MALGTEAFKLALGQAGLGPSRRGPGRRGRAPTPGPCARWPAKVGAGTGGVADDLTATVGNPGAAQPGLLLARALERAEPGQVLALVVLADGADVILLRATDALAAWTAGRSGRRPGRGRTRG